MFTGLIQKTGTVKRVSRGAGLVLEIAFEPWEKPLEKGESVAVNGVCLTVAAGSPDRFTAHVLKETEDLVSVAQCPWKMIPLIFVIITVLAFNFLGDGMRDAADPYK